MSISSEVMPRSRLSLPLPETRNLLRPVRWPVAEMSDTPDLNDSLLRSIVLLENFPLNPVILLSSG